MGSPLRLTLPGRRDAQADAAWALVSTVFRQADRELTRFDPHSSLSRLNLAAGRTVVVAQLLARALHAAWRAYRTTDGRFDPRIIGALEAAGERAGIGLPASPARLRPTDRWLWLDRRRGRGRITAPIDLGGIGKGLALRWGTRALERAGHRDFLLQAGGDIVARGSGPADRPWLVGIEAPPGARHSPPVLIELHDEAVATSSIAVRRWSAADGGVRHHLIDPAAGRPAEVPWWSVTVRARDPAWAEVASKVGFLAGDRIGQALEDRFSWWACDRDRWVARDEGLVVAMPHDLWHRRVGPHGT
jgi:FAD:protein FMN transferase